MTTPITTVAMRHAEDDDDDAGGYNCNTMPLQDKADMVQLLSTATVPPDGVSVEVAREKKRCHHRMRG